jgi:methylenetetrahydrofolate dehydrogenase (NADP+) / methenyltetrahydrofolate cyclohydrolase
VRLTVVGMLSNLARLDSTDESWNDPPLSRRRFTDSFEATQLSGDATDDQHTQPSMPWREGSRCGREAVKQMSATIMDGRQLSDRLKPELRRYADELLHSYQYPPQLAALQVGNDPASRQYVRNKRRLAEELGFASRLVTMAPEEATTQRLAGEIAELNADSRVTGILIQLPLPAKVDNFRLFDAIAPEKDVDGVGAGSIVGLYRGGSSGFIPCTPRGVLTLLDHYQVPVDGAEVVVIGRSDIAGKPLSLILSGYLRNATVTCCHRHTRNLERICRRADILLSCAGTVPAGQEYLVTAEMVKPGSCVIDVGFRRLASGRFTGDVDFEAVKPIAGWITPNPGGTGPMTVIALMQNLIDAARCRLGLARATYSI